MCRHLAYLGPPVAPRRAAVRRAPLARAPGRRPGTRLSGDTNPDGWGVAWYDAPATPTPAWYRTVTPMWDDRDVRRTRGRSSSGAFLAAARLASPGATLDPTPATRRSSPTTWSFSLNGIVHGFPDGVGDELRASVEPGRRARIVGDADTEVLFALVLERLDAGKRAGRRRSPPSCDDVARRHRPAGSTCCSPTAARRARHARRQLAVPPRPRRSRPNPRRRPAAGQEIPDARHLARRRRRRRHPARRRPAPKEPR